MNYRAYLYLLITLCYNCKSINKSDLIHTECSNDISIKYHEADADDYEQKMVADENKKDVLILFEAYFDGLVEVHLDEKIVFNETIKTDEALGTTEKYFSYNYAKEKKLPKIKIKKDDECLFISINPKYKIIYLNYYESHWDVIYSNVYPTYE